MVPIPAQIINQFDNRGLPFDIVIRRGIFSPVICLVVLTKSPERYSNSARTFFAISRTQSSTNRGFSCASYCPGHRRFSRHPAFRNHEAGNASSGQRGYILANAANRMLLYMPHPSFTIGTERTEVSS